MTHRPTFVSKYSSQGFSQQLSKSTNKTCVPRNTFINGGNLQPAEFYTKDSCKLFQQLVTECTDQYRLYSLVHLLQQPVTEELMEKIEFNTVKIVVNFIQQLVTQCTYWLHSLVHLLQKLVTVYRLVLATQLVHSLQQLVTVCTDRLPASQPYTVASTGYSVPATQPCTLASTTGYRVYRVVLATQPSTLASTTGYRVYRLVLATQPSTLASTYGLQVY